MVYQTGPSIFYQKDIIDSHHIWWGPVIFHIGWVKFPVKINSLHLSGALLGEVALQIGVAGRRVQDAGGGRERADALAMGWRAVDDGLAMAGMVGKNMENDEKRMKIRESGKLSL